MDKYLQKLKKKLKRNQRKRKEKPTTFGRQKYMQSHK
tara:strand:- start:1473 stop:1583 length:111 start_codon:yes stop_codon:yes gene_type:complete